MTFINYVVEMLQIMYLNAANNNRSDTNLAFFSQAVEEFGYPLR